ncbi:MAG: LysR family transcriptional regulator, partial [Pseudomonadota bacterium]
MDWNQLRGFLKTAETGSLSAAARDLGLTQPTLSRQVKALEQALGVTLFERMGKNLVLTETGRELAARADQMSRTADDLALMASGRSEAPEGLVSISASDGMAAF